MKFIKFSHVLANFTRISKFLPNLLPRHLSVDFNLAAWLKLESLLDAVVALPIGKISAQKKEKRKGES